MRRFEANVLAFPCIQMILCRPDNHFFIAVAQLHFVDSISKSKLNPDFSFLKESNLVAFFNVDIYSLILRQD